MLLLSVVTVTGQKCLQKSMCYGPSVLSLWDWFRCLIVFLSVAHTDFTLTLLTGLLLVYPM